MGAAGIALQAAPVAAASRPSLDAATTTSSDAWVVVPMGQLSDRSNTFWQLVHTPVGSSTHWTVVTPPGVADNGGLVASSASGSVLAGIVPSGLLRFSPLATSDDEGTSWSPALLPAGLAAVPDALAYRPGGAVSGLAVAGSRVLAAGKALASWSSIATTAGLRRAAPGCGVTRPQAVAFSPTGTAMIGSGCARGGMVGLFTSGTTGWQAQRVILGGPVGGSATEVLRLETTGQDTTALVRTSRGPHQALVALWHTAGSWSRSRPLTVPAAWRVLSTAVEPGGSVSVLLASSHGTRAVLVAPGRPWARLPQPPPGTEVLAAFATTSTLDATPLDAFSVAGTTLTVFALTPAGSRWVHAQSIRVPIAYGSSG